MNRRNFLKNTSVVAASILVIPPFAFSKVIKKSNPFGIDNKARKFNIKNTYNIKANGEETRLWIPLPLEEDFQKVHHLDYKGNFDEAKIVKNDYDTQVLYVKWSKNKKQRELSLNFELTTKSRSTDFTKANNSMDYPENVKLFLKGTNHIPVNDKIQAFSKNIIKNAKTPLQKAKAIYDWTVTNMYRDNSVIGCGIGDAKKAIEEKIMGGKCTDISSVFVALLRNVNIPAREIFGIRVGQSLISNACGKADEKGFANISGSQHCRVEFFISGIGWVPADPADVTKVRLAHKLTNQDKKFQDVKNYMFGAWEMNWIAFNYARDFVLTPKPIQYPLNMLGYPYAEENEDVLDYYSPKDFSYSYTSQEII